MTRVTLRLFGALLLGSSLLVTACGGKSDGDDAPTFLDETTFRQAFPVQLCALISRCCDDISVPIDQPTCLAQAEEAVDSLTFDGTAYDGAAAAACLNGYSEALARCAIPSDSAISACNGVYEGTVPAGGPCLSEGDCAGDAYCEPDATGTFVCVSYDYVATPGREGEACITSCAGDSSEPCGAIAPPGSPPDAKVCYEADGLTCDFTTSLCTPSPGLGQPCDYYCAAGAYCDFNTALCVPTLRDGEFCETAEQCQSRQCGDGGCGGGTTIDAAVCSQF